MQGYPFRPTIGWSNEAHFKRDVSSWHQAEIERVLEISPQDKTTEAQAVILDSFQILMAIELKNF